MGVTEFLDKVSRSSIQRVGTTPSGSGTVLTLHVDYTPNRLERVAKGTTEKQMRKGMNGLADDLKRKSERITTVTAQGASHGTP